MEPRIDQTQFGSVTIKGELFAPDVIIRLGGQVEQRNKKLSKAVYGTSHTISLAEAKHIHQKGVARLLIGAGQHGTVTLSEAAAAYFARHRCQVELLSTPEVIPVWNQAQGAVIGLVHVTCRGERRRLSSDGKATRFQGRLAVAEFSLTSSAFADGGSIPRRHTCDGEDRSPPLSWSAPPTGIRSLALVLDDPDAPGGRFIHWLGWGITSDTGGLGEGEAAPREGRNDFGTVGYRGPCPPRGHGPHRYRFRLHAVAEELRLPSGAGVRELEQALGAKGLAVAELVGTYQR